MQTTALAGAGIALFLAVGVGVVAHELSHAAVLYLLGVPCDIGIGPERVKTGQLGVNIPGTWATVTPREIPETSPRALRLASVAPLALVVPVVTVVAGTGSEPLQATSPLLSAWTVGWLACAIPSPQDFSVFWHAERAVAERTAEPPEG